MLVKAKNTGEKIGSEAIIQMFDVGDDNRKVQLHFCGHFFRRPDIVERDGKDVNSLAELRKQGVEESQFVPAMTARRRKKSRSRFFPPVVSIT